MHTALKRIASTTTVMMIAGLGVTGAAGAAGAAGDSCSGMTAPANTTVLNQAPTPANDTATAIAGQVTSFKVLANDTDPDGNKLYVVSASTPARGETCVTPTGIVEFGPDSSTSDYSQVITYGVTDGDRYRTATLTVNVEGVKPLAVRVTKRLVLKKHSKKVKQRAVIAFGNPNKHNVVVVVGDPKRSKPDSQLTIAPGRTSYFTTKLANVTYVSVLPGPDDDFSIVSIGRINTKKGRNVVVGNANDFRTGPGSSVKAGDLWSHR